MSHYLKKLIFYLFFMLLPFLGSSQNGILDLRETNFENKIVSLNTTWRFFSPNPQMQTIFYEAIGYSEAGDVVYQKEHQFPELMDLLNCATDIGLKPQKS